MFVCECVSALEHLPQHYQPLEADFILGRALFVRSRRGLKVWSEAPVDSASTLRGPQQEA